MAEKIFTVQELKKVAKDQGYKRVGLFSISGDKLLAFNSTREEIADRFKKIETKLKGPAIDEGYYIIEMRTSFGNSVTPDKFVIRKGNPKGDPEALIVESISEPAAKKGENPHILTYESALKFETEILQLKAENTALKKEVTDLEECLEELNELGDEEENPIGNWIQSTTDQLMPAFDRFMKLKERSMNVEEMKMAYAHMDPNDPRHPRNSQRQQQPMNGHNGHAQGPGQQPPPYQEPGPDRREDAHIIYADEFDKDQPPQEGTPEFMQWCTWMSETHPQQYNEMVG